MHFTFTKLMNVFEDYREIKKLTFFLTLFLLMGKKSYKKAGRYLNCIEL